MPPATAAESKPTDIIADMIDNPIFAWIVKALLAIAFVGIMILIAKGVSSMIKNKIIAYTKDDDGKLHQTMQIADLVKEVVFYSMMVFAVFIGFEILGFDVGLILGGISFGVGLAFKEVLGNMVSGVLLLTMKELNLGDTISIDVGGTEYFGTIEEISIRTTTIRLFNHKQVVLPNIKIIESAIKTYSTEDLVRLETTIEVSYSTNTLFAIKVLKQAVNGCEFIKNPSNTKILTHDLGASGITMRCLFYVDPNCGWNVPQLTGHVNHVLVEYCRANGISIPYPHTTLHLKGALAKLAQ